MNTEFGSLRVSGILNHCHYPMDWLMELCSYYCLKRCQTALEIEQPPLSYQKICIEDSTNCNYLNLSGTYKIN